MCNLPIITHTSIYFYYNKRIFSSSFYIFCINFICLYLNLQEILFIFNVYYIISIFSIFILEYFLATPGRTFILLKNDLSHYVRVYRGHGGIWPAMANRPVCFSCCADGCFGCMAAGASWHPIRDMAHHSMDGRRSGVSLFSVQDWLRSPWRRAH